jgi:hypothetical protein
LKLTDISEFQSQESYIVQTAGRRGVLCNQGCGKEGMTKEGNRKQHNRGSMFSVENSDIPTDLCEQAFT